MIIDAHTHIYPDSIAQKAAENISDFYDLNMRYNGTVGSLLAMGGKAGVEKYVVHSVATLPRQVNAINEFIAGAVNSSGGKFIGFATLHPDDEDIAGHIDNAMALGLKGVKLHPDFQRFHIDGPRAMKLFEAIEGRLPVLIHAGDYRTDFSKPGRIVNVMKTFPKLDVIAAHLGGWSEWGDYAGELADRGVYVDTSSSRHWLPPGTMRELMDIFGEGKVFFGSDYPMWDASDELDMLMKILRDDKEKEQILHANFERLMEKYSM